MEKESIEYVNVKVNKISQMLTSPTSIYSNQYAKIDFKDSIVFHVIFY